MSLEILSETERFQEEPSSLATPKCHPKQESSLRLRYPLANSIFTVLHVRHRHGDYRVRFPQKCDTCHPRKAFKSNVTWLFRPQSRSREFHTYPKIRVLLFIQVTFEQKKIRFKVTFWHSLRDATSCFLSRSQAGRGRPSLICPNYAHLPAKLLHLLSALKHQFIQPLLASLL